MRGIHGINLQTSVLHNMKVCSTHDGGARVRKGAWTREEDILLKKCIEKYGEGKWQLVPSRAGLNRCRKSCRLRWMNYLKPDIKRGEFMADEVDLILRLHRLLGNRWALIAGRIPGRTANDVKNYWNTYLRKKVEFSHKKNSTKNSNDNNNNNNIAKHNIIKPRPWTFKKQQPALMINGSTITIDTDIQTTENGCNNIHSEPAVVSPPVLEESSNKYWWESLFDDCIFNEGITNSFVSSSPGLADHCQLNKNNNNNNIANCLSDEVEPALRTPLPNCNDITDGGTTNSHGVLVEDQGQQTCWTDFIMDMDLWNNTSPMQTKRNYAVGTG